MAAEINSCIPRSIPAIATAFNNDASARASAFRTRALALASDYERLQSENAELRTALLSAPPQSALVFGVTESPDVCLGGKKMCVKQPPPRDDIMPSKDSFDGFMSKVSESILPAEPEPDTDEQPRSSAASSLAGSYSSKKLKRVQIDDQVGLRERVSRAIMSRQAHKRLQRDQKETELARKRFAYVGRKARSMTEQRERRTEMLGLRICDILSTVAIVVNFVFMGAEVQMAATSWGEEQYDFTSVHLGFNIWYGCELLFRLCYQCKYHILCEDVGWNLFDAVMLAIAILELAFPDTGAGGSGGRGVKGITRFARMARVTRIIRVGRALRGFHDFCKLLFAVVHAWRTLLLAVVTLCFFMYIVGLIMTQGVVFMLEDNNNDAETYADVLTYWGSLNKSLLTLYLSISNGDSWINSLKPLQRMAWMYPALFMSFLAFTFLGVLNVLTSLFVESAMETRMHYKELVIAEHAQRMERLVEHLHELFREIDTDNSGYITLPEMRAFLDHGDSKDYLDAIGIEHDDALLLFKLIDREQTGKVSLKEFINSCKRLQGPARSFDSHCMLLQIKSWSAGLEKSAQPPSCP
eukprot:TRINITY_DN27469_c0_g1_i1.p1 TRINITY_DN27469_c0_g1~~TRINITY_DN27469_c0_g1_i1.p1  ORF type:complete len:582 (+),score=71.92 TRINITY_DN27469_c0_g1_i1:41-1786(+)